MYKTFLEYNENRDNQTFGSKYANLCEAIATSGVPFEQYWENVGLPTVLKAPYMSNEGELLNEFWKGLGQKIGGMFGMGGGQQQAAAAPEAPAAAPQPHKHQGRADTAVKSVSDKFQVAMRDFLKSVSDEAKQSNDRFTWQIAKMFHDKAVKSMQSFAVNVKNGQDPMAAQFANDRGAMQGQKQADLKQQLMKKRGMSGGATNVGGPPTTNAAQRQPANSHPTAAAARQQFPSGAYMNAESVKNEDDLMLESLVKTYSHRSKFYPF